MDSDYEPSDLTSESRIYEKLEHYSKYTSSILQIINSVLLLLCVAMSGAVLTIVLQNKVFSDDLRRQNITGNVTYTLYFL